MKARRVPRFTAKPTDSPRFSEWSEFEDPVWRLEEPMAGQRPGHGAFVWNITVGAGESLLDDRFSKLRWNLRVFVWTLVHDPRGSKALTPGGLTHLWVAIASGVRWMVAEGMSDFTMLDSPAGWRFLDHFLRTHEEPRGGQKRRPAKITWASASARLKFVMLVHRQRKALQRFGVCVPGERPFDGFKVDQLVQHHLDLHRGDAPDPIPDDVALRIMSATQDWLGARADDIGRLVAIAGDLNFNMRSHTRTGEFTAYQLSREALETFRFSTPESGAIPWMDLRDGHRRVQLDGRISFIKGRQMLRWLLLSVQGAAVACIQATTGIRANEFAGFEDDGSPGPLPSCIEKRRSEDGLLDLFYVRGTELKVTKEKGVWLVGSRLAGTKYLPPPVRAFSLLHTLFATWRDLGGHAKLLVRFSSSRGLPMSSSSIGVATSEFITTIQKKFVLDCCDMKGLPPEHIERFVDDHKLRGQLWRRTFANFLFRIDARLIEPLSRVIPPLLAAVKSGAKRRVPVSASV